MRRPGRWVAAAIVLVIAVALVHSVATNPRFEWGVVGNYLFDARILRRAARDDRADRDRDGDRHRARRRARRSCGCRRTRSCRAASWLYIWFFRGTPVLVQLLFWYNIAALYPKIALGIPFGPAFVHADANTLITPFTAAILGLGLNEGAYMAEIVRAGIISVDEGQTDAAQSLGMTRLQTMRRIVLPQAMRVIIPPTGNETISMLKTTSLASVIVGHRAAVRGAADLLGQLQDDPAADRREHLVPRLHERAVRRAVLPRAPLRPRRARRAGADAAAAHPRADCCSHPATQPCAMSDADGQGRGRAQALRAPRGAQGHHLEVAPGEVMCLLGPSGSGKSTFLRCINHLEKIDAGPPVGRRRARRLPRRSASKLHELREAEVARKRAEIGMVFQHFNLFPHMTALENVTWRRSASRASRASRRASARARAARPRRPGRQGRRLPGAALRRPAAARRDRARAGDGARS